MNRRTAISVSAIAALAGLGGAASFGKDSTSEPGLLAVKAVPGMGRGVFATRPISAGTIVLSDFCIQLSKADRAILAKSILRDYYFEDEDDDTALLAIGLASLINHSFKTPNVEHESELTGEGYVISFAALRDIKAGEQLFFDYEFDADKIPAWADNPR